jgi:hypothetical protein
MNVKQLVITQLEASKWLFDKFIADFTDGDAQYQPCEGANHLNWMLMHLAVTEDGITARLAGTPKKYAEALHQSYGPGSTCQPNDGMTRTEAIKLFNEAFTRTVEFVKNFDESRCDEKAPEGFPPMFPTVGGVLALLGAHPFWHFGQLSVNRRLLNKPRVLGKG